MLPTGRAAMQKKIMALLRKIDTCTQGVRQSWDETYRTWDSTTMALLHFPKLKSDDLAQSEFHRMGKRRPSHHRYESKCVVSASRCNTNFNVEQLPVHLEHRA